MNHVLQVLMLSASLVASPFTYANEDKGLEIAQERKARDEGWGDSIATMEMILKNAQGESSTRLMRLKSLEVEGDGDKGLTILTSLGMSRARLFSTILIPLVRMTNGCIYLP